MARLARVVAAHIPHHVTQRGNRRQKVFFCDEDYEVYLKLLSEGCRQAGVSVSGYCLMPNHVHLILTPRTEDGLREALGETHRRYTRHINFREGWRGYLWQGRFSSFPMDEKYLLACARYVELNPVRARLVKHPEDWRWSSARAHLCGKDDGLVNVATLKELVSDWSGFLSAGLREDELEHIRASERTGRPLGSDQFVGSLEQKLDRSLTRQRPGPKPQKKAA